MSSLFYLLAQLEIDRVVSYLKSEIIRIFSVELLQYKEIAEKN